MSNLYEALKKGRESLSGLSVEPLWDQSAQAAHPSERNIDAPAETVSPSPSKSEPKPETKESNGAEFWEGIRRVRVQVQHNAPILPFDGSHREAGEQYRILRTKLVQHPAKPRVILVASLGPGEGKTVTVINLSGALALKSEVRVLLLDGDFRRSTTCWNLGIEADRGLADVLRGDCKLQQAMLQVEQIPNLFLLPPGKAPGNPAEMLDSANWNALFAACRSHFSYIVVDGPPIAAVADYDLLRASSDAIVLVARPDKTNRAALLRALQLMPADKCLGVVLNCFQPSILDHRSLAYGYYYQAGEY